MYCVYYTTLNGCGPAQEALLVWRITFDHLALENGQVDIHDGYLSGLAAVTILLVVMYHYVIIKLYFMHYGGIM